MAEPILTVEQLDEILTNKPATQSEYEAAFGRIAASKLALRNKRSQVKTLEDALDGYEGLLADARKKVEEGLAKQVHRLKEMGRVGTLNFQWGLDVGFSEADWVLKDHEGPQELRNRVLAANYGMSLKDDYNPLIKSHDGALNLLRKQQADERLASELSQAQRLYETELARIEGDD